MRAHYTYRRRQQGERRTLVTCPECGRRRRKRLAEVNFYRRRGTFTGRCLRCCARNKLWNAWRARRRADGAGRYVSPDGYAFVYRWALSPMLQPWFDVIARSPGRAVREHRVVMAAHLGRPLGADEVVHHRNGCRSDNRLENLRVFTTARHHPGSGDFYQEWQEALHRIRELEAQALNQLLAH